MSRLVFCAMLAVLVTSEMRTVMAQQSKLDPQIVADRGRSARRSVWFGVLKKLESFGTRNTLSSTGSQPRASNLDICAFFYPSLAKLSLNSTY